MPRILIARRESIRAAITGILFLAEGYDVTLAPPGPEAIASLEGEGVDVALVDEPSEDTRTLAAALRETNAAISVIYLDDGDRPSDEAAFGRSRVPADLTRLPETIDHLLRRRAC